MNPLKVGALFTWQGARFSTGRCSASPEQKLPSRRSVHPDITEAEPGKECEIDVVQMGYLLDESTGAKINVYIGC